MLSLRPRKVPDKVKARVLLHINTLHIQYFLSKIMFHDPVYVKKKRKKGHIENLLVSTIMSWWKIVHVLSLRRTLSLAGSRKCGCLRF